MKFMLSMAASALLTTAALASAAGRHPVAGPSVDALPLHGTRTS